MAPSTLHQRQRMPQAAPSLGSFRQSASWAALAGHIGLILYVYTGGRAASARPPQRQHSRQHSRHSAQPERRTWRW
eukprot:scaffold84678_cov64-Phaeocystis_antarctica.AAC.3